MNKRRKRTKAEQRARRAKCKAANAQAARHVGVLNTVLGMDDCELRAFENFIKEVGAGTAAEEEKGDPQESLEIVAALTLNDGTQVGQGRRPCICDCGS
jgi:hypothetical protein